MSFPDTSTEIDHNQSKPIIGVKMMSKEQKGNKEAKKKPTMTPKEKKLAKKAKKDSKKDAVGNL